MKTWIHLPISDKMLIQTNKKLVNVYLSFKKVGFCYNFKDHFLSFCIVESFVTIGVFSTICVVTRAESLKDSTEESQ